MDVNKIIARAKAILLTPKTEWPLIAAEPDTVGGVFSNYVVVLAGVATVAKFVSMSLVGTSLGFFGSYRVPVGAGLGYAILSYALSLLGVYILALIIDALAPTFEGTRDRLQALKTVAYAFTAGWVAAVIGIVPGLGALSAIAGLVYGIYLLYIGLPVTMKCPPDKAAGFTAVSIIAAIVVMFIVNSVAGATLGFGLGLHALGAATPGLHRDSGNPRLEEWSKQVEQAGRQLDSAQKSGDAAATANAVGQVVGAALGAGGKVDSLPADRIKAFLPDALDGLKRTEFSTERNGAAGVQISVARATYSDGAGRTLHLEITDTGALKGIIGFAAGWAGVEQDHETDTGFEKTYLNGGRIVHEQWDKPSHSGEYAVVVAQRFAVKVEGSAAGLDALKAALSAVDLPGLEALKNEGVK